MTESYPIYMQCVTKFLYNFKSEIENIVKNYNYIWTDGWKPILTRPLKVGARGFLIINAEKMRQTWSIRMTIYKELDYEPDNNDSLLTLFESLKMTQVLFIWGCYSHISCSNYNIFTWFFFVYDSWKQSATGQIFTISIFIIIFFYTMIV